jgi:accessory gene regulator B
MIEKWSEDLAMKIKSMNPENTHSVSVLKYGLIIILNSLFTLLFIVLIGILTNHLSDTLLSMFSFAFLRLFSGGYHFKSATLCTLFSAAIFSIIPIVELNASTTFLFNILTCLLVCLYAPSSIEKQSNIPKKYYPYLKKISLAIVATNFFFLSDIVSLSFFVQSLMLIRFERR